MRTLFVYLTALQAVATQHGVALAQAAVPAPALAKASVIPSPDVASRSLDSMIARAVSVSPLVRAAESRIDAARARIGPTSALPDPMLMLGLINQPLGRMPTPAGDAMPVRTGPDEMTMRMVGVTQTLPFPGKRSLARRGAELDVDVSRATLEMVRRQVVHDVRAAWYEIAFVDEALLIADRNHDVLAGLIHLAESRYAVGAAGQQDMLRARVEATRLGETASALAEQRGAAVSRLNVLLDQPTTTEPPRVTVPEAIAHAAVQTSADAIRFTSMSLGARVADSPLRPLAELQDAAVRSSPELREQDALLAAQGARLELARKASLPDVDLSLQYGQRSGGLPDMITAIVSFPLPVFRARKQDQQVIETTAQLSALTADRAARANMVRTDVARLVSEIERERTRLALAVKAILPQGRAALASAVSGYQVGKAEFVTVLENQATVFSYETDYFRALSDFATLVAELERVVGEEVLK